MDWDNYRAFLEVYRSGDLGNAARESEMSVPTVRRRLDAVESEIGFALFERTPRGLSPTPVARRLVQTIAAMGESAAAARALRDTSIQEVTVASGEAIAANYLVPVWSKVRMAHPAAAVNLLIRRRRSDLISANADIILSHDRPVGQTAAAHKCGMLDIGLFGHRDYLARAGVPTSTSDLDRFTIIGAESEGANRRLHAPLDLPPGATRHTFKTNSMVAHLGAIRAGLGIGVIYADLAARDPNLVQVLPEAGGAVECWVWSPRPGGLDEAAGRVFDAIVGVMAKRVRPAAGNVGVSDAVRAPKPIAA